MDLDLANLNEQRATEFVRELLNQLVEARGAVEQFERRAAGVRRIISGLVEMFPALEDLLPEDIDPDEGTRPRGMEAIRRVLDEKRGDWFAVGGVVHLLKGEGWLPESSNPANAVRTALERAVEAGVAVKGRTVGGGVIYRSTQEPYPDEEPF
jgi:hypothetical protein